MTTERAKFKIGRWVDETMKGKFDNFVGSRKKSNTNASAKTANEIPTTPVDIADEQQLDVDLLNSVKPAELYSKTMETAFEDETTSPPVYLPDVDLGVLFGNLTQKRHLEEVSSTDERDAGKMIQQHLELL